MWSRLVHDETSLRKAVIISLRAAANLIYKDLASDKLIELMKPQHLFDLL